MTFVITETCIDVKDQTCVEVCPVDCIHFEEDKDRILYIDPVECIDCGACVPVCPEDAIFDEPDVPEDQQRFTEINALWYQDPDAARAQVGGAAAPAAEGAPAEAAAAATEAAEAPAETEEAAAPVAASGAIQVEAPAPGGAAIAASGSRPVSAGLIALTGLSVALVLMALLPGPRWLTAGDVELHAAVLLLTPPALVFLLLFLRAEARAQGAYAAPRERERESAAWRDTPADWRRSEESRLDELTHAVTQIAENRFPFPNAQFPNYRTHVNVPRPTMALEFTDGGGERLFPDIVVVEYPGNYPVIVVQVETRETLTREQAERVWSRLQTAEAPLNIYVPAGLAAHARDYARAAGIDDLRLRTWRRGPNGIIVREI